jgi:protein-S-isoprenylcysteine O-methyltransferase Ste14
VILLKTLLFTVVVPGSVTVLVPWLLLSWNPSVFGVELGAFRFLGLLPLAAGAVIYFKCALDFTFTGKGTPLPMDAPRVFVERGLYRYVRNPMYVGVLSVIAGESLFFESFALFVFACVVFLVFNSFVFFYEEPVLKKKFGEPYKRYLASVPRWIPRKARKSSGQ